MDRGVRWDEHILWIRICMGEDEWRMEWRRMERCVGRRREVRGREGGVRVEV